MKKSDGFLAAVYAAIDAERTARGLSWRQVMAEINGRSGVADPHPIATSTVRGLATKAVAEGDGVLAMLRWLKRSPESFADGHGQADAPGECLPDPRGQVLRFDTVKIHALLDARRLERGLTLQQVALEIGGTSSSSLTHLRKGGRTGFPGVLRIARWLHLPVAALTRLSPY